MSSATAVRNKKPFVNVHEAKTHLSALLEQVERGGEVIIARAGRPIAKLTGYVPPPTAGRTLGALRTKIRVADDAFSRAADDQVAKIFEGGDDPKPA